MAQEAEAAREALRCLTGIKASAFDVKQRETARLALCWGEQYLEGYLDAVGDSCPFEASLAAKQKRQIRQVRLEHFGLTENEASISKCSSVAIGSNSDWCQLSMLLKPVCVVCNECKTYTNGYKVGDTCSQCKTGTFEPA